MNAPPLAAPGGSKPVVAYLRHSIMVYKTSESPIYPNLYNKCISYCFSGTIASNDERQGCTELYSGSELVIEGADPRDRY
jgi:hypothetical protein